MRNDFYDDRDCDPGEELMTVASRCSRFDRRSGVTSFNMTDYRSCENCSHMTAGNQCALRMEDRFTDAR